MVGGKDLELGVEVERQKDETRNSRKLERRNARQDKKDLQPAVVCPLGKDPSESSISWGSPVHILLS
jgi:hypothetical protein